MTPDQPSNPSVKSPGRGRDLFFGDEPEDGSRRYSEHSRRHGELRR